MTEIKHDICDEVFYFNDASQTVDSSTVKGIRVLPKALHKDDKGREVLDEAVVLYTLSNDVVVPEAGAFGSREECVKHYASLFASL